MGRRHKQPNPELLSLETAAESELMSSARERPHRRRFPAVMGALAPLSRAKQFAGSERISELSGAKPRCLHSSAVLDVFWC